MLDIKKSSEYDKIKELQKYFELYPQIKLVYLFGSKAEGKDGPLSDYDFAVYLDEKDKKKRDDLRLKLIADISSKLKTNEVDVCILNDIEAPEFKYNVVKNGILIFEKEPFKLLVEPHIFNEYFDFRHSLIKYNLTKAYD